MALEGSCLLIDRQARPPGRPELRSCESTVCVCVGVQCDVVNICVGAPLHMVVSGFVYVSVFRRLVASSLKVIPC